MSELRAPFPYWGGKSRVAPLVWRYFGNVPNYVEPFFGSGAVLLGRPAWHFNAGHRIETVNDLDTMIANFWRALAAEPDAVATWADWPVNEADLHARHNWLLQRVEFRQRMHTDPDYYDARVAGWWVWGICQWIGSGWCDSGNFAPGEEWQQLPHLGNAGMGVHRPSQQLPHLGDAGMGVHRPSQQLPHLGDAGRGVHRPSQKLPHLMGAGRGVHRPSQQLPHLGDAGRGVHRPSQKLPHLGDAGMGVHRPSQQLPHLMGAGRGVHRPSQQLPHLMGAGRGDLYDYFAALAARLRSVRVCCGDWTRVLGPTPTEKNGMTGIFLDPPYSAEADRDGNLYAVDDLAIAHNVRQWAVEHGDNPSLRIALCGYGGEHDMPGHWTAVSWKAHGGYGSQGNGRGRENAARETIWFSPSCLLQAQAELPLRWQQNEETYASA